MTARTCIWFKPILQASHINHTESESELDIHLADMQDIEVLQFFSSSESEDDLKL